MRAAMMMSASSLLLVASTFLLGEIGRAQGLFLSKSPQEKKKGQTVQKKIAFLRHSAAVSSRKPLDAGVFETHGSDAELMVNPWQGDNQKYEFRFADDMNPVAPMDRIASTAGVNSLTGGFKDAQYVPPYLYPDPFPGHKHMAAGHDKTFWAGNYWAPKDIRNMSGIAAPEDKLPPKHYPVQAPADEVRLIPPQAKEDRIPTRFARYIDQVADRAEACQSPECMSPCKGGDTVQATLGNIHIENANLVGQMEGNTQGAIIEYADELGSEDCVSQGCTVMNPCMSAEKSLCTGFTVENSRDPGPEPILRQKSVCPKGYKPCKSFRMTVATAALMKDGKECSFDAAAGEPEAADAGGGAGASEEANAGGGGDGGGDAAAGGGGDDGGAPAGTTAGAAVGGAFGNAIGQAAANNAQPAPAGTAGSAVGAAFGGALGAAGQPGNAAEPRVDETPSAAQEAGAALGSGLADAMMGGP